MRIRPRAPRKSVDLSAISAIGKAAGGVTRPLKLKKTKSKAAAKPKPKPTEKKPGRPKKEPVTSGPKATHLKVEGTGELHKLTPKDKKAINQYVKKNPEVTIGNPTQFRP